MPSNEYQSRKTTNHRWNMYPTSSGSRADADAEDLISDLVEEPRHEHEERSLEAAEVAGLDVGLQGTQQDVGHHEREQQSCESFRDVLSHRSPPKGETRARP